MYQYAKTLGGFTARTGPERRIKHGGDRTEGAHLTAFTEWRCHSAIVTDVPATSIGDFFVSCRLEPRLGRLEVGEVVAHLHQPVVTRLMAQPRAPRVKCEAPLRCNLRGAIYVCGATCMVEFMECNLRGAIRV